MFSLKDISLIVAVAAAAAAAHDDDDHHHDHHESSISIYANSRSTALAAVMLIRFAQILGRLAEFAKKWRVDFACLFWLKNREDGSDFDDFWTKSIATTRSSFSKIFTLAKKFSRRRKIFRRTDLDRDQRDVRSERPEEHRKYKIKTTSKVPMKNH